MYKEIVKNNNPIAYQIIKNSIENNKLSHSFIFSASNKVEIKDEPLFLIQSIISEDPFGEGKLREPLSYADLIVINGTDSSIKKEDVVQAMNKLQETSLEKDGNKILLINNIENANVQSLNSLLKFIEEPTKNTYIIMTTNDVSKILTTIKSRSQIIKVPSKSVEHKKEEIKKVVEIKGKYLEALAKISLDAEHAKTIFENDFISLYDSVEKIMERSLTNKERLITELLPLITKKNYEIVANLLSLYISDIWRNSEGLKLFFGSHEIITKYFVSGFRFDNALRSINHYLVVQTKNANFDLSKSQLILELKGCYR